MNTLLRLVTGTALVFALIGCVREATSPAGFRLPDGDPVAGRETFVELFCYDCHTVTNETFPESISDDFPDVILGGESTRVRTYGELVTSIINPSHELARGYALEDISEDGESLMRNYNEFMTVQQLTDLVMFLQPHYRVVIPQYVYHPFP